MLKKNIVQYPQTINFALFFAIYLLYIKQKDYILFYWDSSYYWGLSHRFYHDSHFDLTNYFSVLRTYSFPLLCSFLRFIADITQLDEGIVWKLFASTAIVSFGSVLVPAFITRLFSISTNFWQIFLFQTLIFIFWRGYIHFPLTDFTTSILFLWGIYYLFPPCSKKSLFLSALLIGLVMNMRPAFFLVGFPLLILVWLNNAKKWRYVALFLIGMSIFQVPQMLINYVHSGTLSPVVDSSKSFYKPHGLYFWQLKMGLANQKYETNIGQSYPENSVTFSEPLSKQLKTEIENINEYFDYIAFVVKYPLQTISIYSRHVFNGLDLKYETPYIKDLYDYFHYLSLLNYTIIFLSLLIVFRFLPKITWESTSVNLYTFLLAWLFPVVLSIPILVETRFFLNLHLLMYAVVCFADLSVYKQLGLKKKQIWVIYLFFILICLMLSTNTWATLSPSTLS